jgi:hypothetical protein
MKLNLNDDRKITVVKDKESCEPLGVLIDYSDLLGRSL